MFSCLRFFDEKTHHIRENFLCSSRSATKCEMNPNIYSNLLQKNKNKRKEVMNWYKFPLHFFFLSFLWTQISSIRDSKVPRSINKATHRWHVFANGNTVTINWRHYSFHTSTTAWSRIRLRLEFCTSFSLLVDSFDDNRWVFVFPYFFFSICISLWCDWKWWFSSLVVRHWGEHWDLRENWYYT